VTTGWTLRSVYAPPSIASGQNKFPIILFMSPTWLIGFLSVAAVAYIWLWW